MSKKDDSKTPVRKVWTAPRTECLESRAEISAYAGTGQPWIKSR